MNLSMKFKNFFHSLIESKFKGYTNEQYIIMAIVASVFMPFYIGLITMLLLIIYLNHKKQLKEVIRNTPKGTFALIFGAYSLGICLFNKNLLGTAQSLGMLVATIFIMYYRKHVNERLFMVIVDICCVLSLGCFIYGVFEYAAICERLEVSFFAFDIHDSPKNRVQSMFFNANYYATIIQFVVLLCIYKILHSKSFGCIAFYGMTILCNLFALYLTGCRVGWLSFAITIPLMFYMSKWKKTSYVMLGFMALVGIIILMNPSIFPRFESIIKDFAKRGRIWTTAIKAIAMYPIFGLGPSGYYLIYEQFSGHPTYHSHSVYLDPFVSFGIVGLSIASVFIVPVFKEIIHLFKNKLNRELAGLIASFFVVLFVHGVFDHTVYWIQTGVLFLLVINAACMFNKKSIEE